MCGKCRSVVKVKLLMLNRVCPRLILFSSRGKVSVNSLYASCPAHHTAFFLGLCRSVLVRGNSPCGGTQQWRQRRRCWSAGLRFQSKACPRSTTTTRGGRRDSIWAGLTTTAVSSRSFLGMCVWTTTPAWCLLLSLNCVVLTGVRLFVRAPARASRH